MRPTPSAAAPKDELRKTLARGIISSTSEGSGNSGWRCLRRPSTNGLAMLVASEKGQRLLRRPSLNGSVISSMLRVGRIPTFCQSRNGTCSSSPSWSPMPDSAASCSMSRRSPTAHCSWPW